MISASEGLADRWVRDGNEIACPHPDDGEGEAIQFQLMRFCAHAAR